MGSFGIGRAEISVFVLAANPFPMTVHACLLLAIHRMYYLGRKRRLQYLQTCTGQWTYAIIITRFVLETVQRVGAFRELIAVGI